jgi:hypothetical protein
LYSLNIIIIGLILTILGIICILIGALILLPNIFIPKEELELLSKLPVEPSTTHLTSSLTQETLPVAVTDVVILHKYKDLYIQNRKTESRKRKKGFIYLIAGSILQIIGVIFTTLGSIS